MDSNIHFPEMSNLPSWATWFAQDADGAWWAYEVEPLQSHNGWYENEVGRRIRVCQTSPPKDWRLMLKKACLSQ